MEEVIGCKARSSVRVLLLVLLLVLLGSTASAGGDITSKFLNRGSVANTRHNLSQRQPGGGGPNPGIMDPYRNNYSEVCVYCHTPHGSSAVVAIPLWNRTIKATTYVTYDLLGTTSLTQLVSQPGANSLSCLSCHDGQIAVDSVINMPGTGGYSSAQATTQDDAFLTAWAGSGATPTHMAMDNAGCLACHTPGVAVGTTAADFRVAAIGTNLRDDHPVGVNYPTANGASHDFKTPGGTSGSTLFFDVDADGRLDSNEIRLYKTGADARVECASCHDPHGVSPTGPGGEFNRTFLRIANTESAVCLTCHSK